MTEAFDVVVVGMGPGGEVAASRLLAAGRRVAVVERELIGGECAYWACIPSKTLLRPAEAHGEVVRAAGVAGARLDWPAARDYRDWMIRMPEQSFNAQAPDPLGASGENASGVSIRYVGGPTVLLQLGDVRLLTDPTFDPPGDHPVGSRVLVKTNGPAVSTEALGPVDAVVLSHDQHPDNLDTLGREFVASVPIVLSTASARSRLGGTTRALQNWEKAELDRPNGGVLRVTGVPAQHGPDGTEHIVGEVTGFVVEGDDLPSVYVSGDNASLNVVRAVAGRLGPVNVAVLFAGAAQTALVPDAYLTLTSELAAEASRLLGARVVVPVHFEGWTHFTQGRDTLVTAFERGGLADRLHLPEPGEWSHLEANPS